MTGMGKSTLNVNIFTTWVNAGNGGALIDLHHELADDVMARILMARLKDVIYFRPGATRSPGLNPVEIRDPKLRTLVAEILVTIMKSVSGTAWGDETGSVVLNAIIAILEAYDFPTIIHVFRFLVDDDHRTGILNIASLKNPFAKFFQQALRRKAP